MTDSQLDLSSCRLKVGIEVHQQLDSGGKLFCACPILKSEVLPLSFERRLRPSQSELGRIDAAALFEFQKGRANLYRWNPESSCLVEADEEPPHPLNLGALETTIIISIMLESSLIDEVHPMRKIVIDGSNTGGFQRTAVVGLGGVLHFGEGDRVGVQSITVEEDAARVLAEDERVREYALDRLGVPLVEIALEPIPDSPEKVEAAALQLGRLLRATGRVARGLGTIRQDLNVSVMGGEVVEVKGVQKLNLIAKVVRYEAARQMGLIRVAEELKRRSAAKVPCTVSDVTNVFANTSSPVLKRVLQKQGSRVFCVSASGLAGLVGFEPFPGIRVGKELGEIARTNSLGGVIHSDEFRKQGITEDEETTLRKRLGCGVGDALVLVAGDAERASTVARLVSERLQVLPQGVPRETRAATMDGETRYLRPRPGAARMYPETDIPDIVITREWTDQLRHSLPVPWEERVRHYSDKYGLSRELALQLYDSERAPLFEAVAARFGLDRKVIASVILEAPIRLSREGVDESRLTDGLLETVVSRLDSGAFAKEGAYAVLRSVARGDAGSVDEALAKLGLSALSEDETEKIVEEVIARNRELIRERGERAMSVLMGEAMKLARGRVDGGHLSELIKKKLPKAGRSTQDASSAREKV